MVETAIADILLTPLDRFANPKGDVFHIMKKSSRGFADYGEAYFTTILPGQRKGWHKHTRMTINFVVPVGSVRFVVFDDRPRSVSRGRYFSIELSLGNYQRLTIPPQLWVALEGRGDALSWVLDIADIEYDEAEVVRAGLDQFPYDWD